MTVIVDRQHKAKLRCYRGKMQQFQLSEDVAATQAQQPTSGRAAALRRRVV